MYVTRRRFEGIGENHGFSACREYHFSGHERVLVLLRLLALSCLGTKGVKGEKITWGRIWTAFAVGFVLFFLNWWLLPLPLPLEAVTGLYVLTIGTGYVCLLMGGLWMSRLLKHNLMEDVFNNENESFMQETRLIESEYSVNLPTRFYYRKRWNNGRPSCWVRRAAASPMPW